MVRFATIADFRVNASRVFGRLRRGDRVVVTRKGKPIAVLEGVVEEDLEDFILAHHPAYRARYEKSRREYRAGKVRRLEDILGL